jgi:hypothetical protein
VAHQILKKVFDRHNSYAQLVYSIPFLEVAWLLVPGKGWLHTLGLFVVAVPAFAVGVAIQTALLKREAHNKANHLKACEQHKQ